MSEVSEGPTSPCLVVIGAGLIGSSVGLAATAAGYRVHLRDSSPANALVADSLGAGSVQGVDPDDVDIVVVAVPPGVAGCVVTSALKEFPHATVTDVASVKSVVVGAVDGQCGIDRYVGSHPMAGSQKSGPLTARADLFTDRTWVVTPHPRSSEQAIDHVVRLAHDCGARTEMMSPAEHDVAVAEVSHVPQIVSTLMAGSLTSVPANHLRLAGQGVRDVTRIAGSEPTMWTQIITANHEAIHEELAKISANLVEVIDHLDSPESVREFMERGLAGTRALPGKHGRVAEDYAYVVVEIPDSPGALARLFSDVGEAGVNVEDLRIEHDEDREVGYISMAVEPDRADGLANVMRGKGWVVKQ